MQTRHLPAPVIPAWNSVNDPHSKHKRDCQRRYFPVHHQRCIRQLVETITIMLNDADASGFKKVYLAMGFTDLRRGIDG